MSQNQSSAVMQQRLATPPDELDYYPTPPFATRALCEWLASELEPEDLRRLSVWEPACGEMHMAKPLAEYFGHVRASDVIRYRPEHEIIDFTFFGALGEPMVDLVATNPPFMAAQTFIENGLALAHIGVAMFVRTAFSEGQDRYHELFSVRPPSAELVFTERVVLLKNRLIQAGAIDPFAEKENTKASTATAYVWLVWLKTNYEQRDTRKIWIPPCRHRLERPGDYPDYAPEMLPPPADGLFGQSEAA